MKLDILYEDNDIIVCHKAPGVASQTERSYDPDMVSLLMNHFHKTDVKKPYVGVVHRLDKPVAGVIIYGKNEKATRLLSEQITHHRFTKKYKAVVCGDISSLDKKSASNLNIYSDDSNISPTVSPATDARYTLTDYLLRDAKTNTSSVVDINSPKYKSNKEVKKSSLSFTIKKTIELTPDNPLYKSDCPYDNKLSLVDIELLTGRHHQIRVQFSHAGYPLWGDLRYSPYAKELGQRKGVALCAYSLTIEHPTTHMEMTFNINPQNSIFKSILAD